MDEANRSLKRVITDYKEYIETTTKGPVVERAKVSDFGGIIVKEDQKVSVENLCQLRTEIECYKVLCSLCSICTHYTTDEGIGWCLCIHVDHPRPHLLRSPRPSGPHRQ